MPTAFNNGKRGNSELGGRAPEVLSSDSEDDDTAETHQNILRSTIELNKLTTVNLDKTLRVCNIYIRSKLTKRIHHEPIRPTIRRLERVYMDLWGQHDPESLNGSRYAFIKVNDFTRKL